MVDGPAPSDAPRLRLDELLSQLVDRAQETLRTQERLRALLLANRSIVGDLDLPAVLRRIVEAATELADAQYGALGVIAPDASGLEAFVHVGMDEDAVRRIGHLPEGKGLLGALIDDPSPIRLDHMLDDPRAAGFPDGHPQMESFLGVPVRVRDEIFGNLYLSNARTGHFTEDDEAVVQALAATAGVAIENARLFALSRRRQEWLQASAEVTRHSMLVGSEAAEQKVVEVVLTLAEADLVLLTSRDGDRLVITAAAGEAAERLRGQSFPSAGTVSEEVFSTGTAALVENAAAREVEGPYAPHVLSIGPTMVVPLAGSAGVRAALIAGRSQGLRRFTEEDLEMAETFATHASAALELAEARQDQQRMVLLEDRTRIARDLHDHVIQQLFAAGMTVQGVISAMGDDPRAPMLDKVVDTLDGAVKQVRTSIFQLRPHQHGGSSLRSPVLAVVSDVVRALGFDPSVSFEGPVDAVSDGLLAEDVVAVVREALSNTAKHAHATSAQVRLHASASRLEVVVTDDGTGLTSDRRSGLQNLRDRAVGRGGTLTINDPPPERGTTLVWSVPLA
jgi:signal transduction histidine kinase